MAHGAIRKAEPRDLAGLNSIIRASKAYEGLYAAILVGWGVGPEALRADEVWAAQINRTLAGFYWLKPAPHAELEAMFVADFAQGMGLGRALLSHAMVRAEALGLKSLKIVAHPPAAGFYEKLGARRVGEKAPEGRVAWPRPVLELTIGEHGHASA